MWPTIAVCCFYIVAVTATIYNTDSIDESNKVLSLIQDCEYIKRVPLDSGDLALAKCKDGYTVFESRK